MRKTNTLMAIAATILTFTATSNLRSQELTPEQVQGDKIIQAATMAQQATASAAKKNLPPRQIKKLLELKALLPEAPFPPDPKDHTKMNRRKSSNVLVGGATPMLMTTAAAEGGGEPQPLIRSGTSFIQGVIQAAGVTDNQMFGVGTFDSVDWYTDTSGQTFNNFLLLPWGLSVRTLTPINGYMAVAHHNLGPGCMSRLYTYRPVGNVYYTNKVVIIGVTNTIIRTNYEAYYAMRFQYMFSTNGSSPRSTFQVCSDLGYNNAATIAVLPTAPNWTEVTIVLTNTSVTKIYWVLTHDSYSPFPNGPTAQLDAVQFIELPGPSRDDFSVSVAANVTTAQWNALTYTTPRWKLEIASGVGPGKVWATNTAPATLDTNSFVSTVRFTNSPNSTPRFYRMIFP